MRDDINCRDRYRRLKDDVSLIQNGYVRYLSERHTAPFTIHLYRGFLMRVAGFLSGRGSSIRDLRRDDVSEVSRACLQGWKAESCLSRISALRLWLRFRGRFKAKPEDVPWQRLLDDYARFMEIHRGLAPCTRDHYLRDARCFLVWQSRLTANHWRRITPEHIWRFAEDRARNHSPKSVSDELSALRQFLRFMHLEGVTAAGLSEAVPRVADYGHAPSTEVLTEAQRRQFLAAFERCSPEGRRDYTMALCMLDLGLRAIEICRLRVCDIDWSRNQMTVPPAKRSSGRQLPIPSHVMKALRVYVKARPQSCHDKLFVGHTQLVGRPLSSCAVGSAMTRAYRRCGFPRHWHGSHRLRHTFATRLSARGADLKQIADLLGHQLVSTTNRYAHVAPPGLRALVQPWPM